MCNDYNIEKNVEKIRRGEATGFLTPNVASKICSKIKKVDYSIFKPFPDSEKVILYSKVEPVVKLFEIESFFPLTHQEIMGSLYGLNISDDCFGDIIIDEDKYYFYTTLLASDFILNNLVMIGNKSIKLKSIDIHALDNYKRRYCEIEFIVSSLRCDNVISKVISSNREKIKEKIKHKEIFVNYEVLGNNSKLLQVGDVFSIRKYGKYKFDCIKKRTKKDNYIIICFKYL